MAIVSMKRRVKFDARDIGCRCDECPLAAYHRERGTFAPVPPEGKPDAEYVFVGEEPGNQEMLYQRPFIGPSGQLLERTLNRLGITRDEVYLDNGLLCRPPNNDLPGFIAQYVAPVNAEIRKQNKGLPVSARAPLVVPPHEACRPHISRVVDDAAKRGAVVIALGKMGFWAITGKKPKIGNVRGSFGEYVRVGDDKYGRPLLAEPTEENAHLFTGSPRIRVCATINPAMAMREGYAGYREVLFRDIERALRWHRGQLQWKNPKYTLLTSHPQPHEFADWLRGVRHATWDVESAAAYPSDGVKYLEDHYQDARENKLRILGIYDVEREQAVVLPWVSLDGRVGFAPGRGARSWETGAIPTGPAGMRLWEPTRSLAAPNAADQTEAYRQGAQRGLAPWWHDFDDYHYTEQGGDVIVDALWRWFENPSQWKIGHFSNYFDTAVMVRMVGPFAAQAALDQILLCRTWNSELPRSLYFIGTMLTDVPAWKAAKDDRVIAREPRTYEELCDYNVVDNYVVAQTVPVLIRSARDQNAWPVVELDHRVQAICREMAALGLWIHEETRAEAEEETRTKLVEEQRIVAEVAGPDFNPRSTKQLAELLYETWGYPVPMLSKSGKPSVSEDAIRVLLTTVGLLAEDHRVMLEALWRSRGWQKDLSDVILPMRRRSAGGIVHEDGVLRCDYSAHIPATGRISSAGPNCFDGETEILTESGWVRFDALPKGLRVAQFWPEDQTIDFTTPEEYVEAPFEGEMVHVHNDQIDLFVTPNHRCLLRSKSGKWKDHFAVDYPEDYKQYHAGRTAAPGGPWTDAQIRLLVALQADGTFRAAPTVGSGLVEYGIAFGFDLPRKIERMRSILQDGGWAYSENQNEAARPDRVTFYLPYSENPSLRDLIYSTLTREKVFGPWVLRLSGQQLDVFTDELWHWDGSFTRKSHYSSSDRRNADWAQIALILAGRQRANLRAYDAPGLTRTNWQVDVTTKPYSWTTNRARDLVSWSGVVYCVSVPSSYIVVRRNGKVAVTGQTQNWRKRLRRIVRPRPGHLFLMADYDQIELRLMCAVAQVAAYLEAFANPNSDPHAVTALLVYGAVFEREFRIYKETGTKTERFTALRRFAKTFVYAVLYGGGASTVYENVAKAVDDDGNLLFPNMTFAQVEAAVKSWMRNAKEVPLWWEKTWATAEALGYTEEPILGRRRHFPEFLRNEAVNHGIQGGAAIIMGQGLIKLRDAFPPDYREGIGIVNQMHDAVTVEVPEHRARELAPIVTNALTCEFPDKLPNMVFSATAEIAIDWSEKHWRAPGDGKAQWGGVVKKTAQIVQKLKTPEAQAQVHDVLHILAQLQWDRMQDQFTLHKLEERVLVALKKDEKAR